MSYLGYSNLAEIDAPNVWANDLALAALVAPSFYDFGELSLHPIMDALNNTEREWVLDIVRAFIVSDLPRYHDVISKHQVFFSPFQNGIAVSKKGAQNIRTLKSYTSD